MLGVTINYKQAELFFRKELGAEWVSMPFQNSENQRLLDLANLNHTVNVEGEVFTKEEVQELAAELEGCISEFSFKQGANEGYMMFLRMASGQIMWIKLWERCAFEKFLCWINRKEAASRLAKKSRIDEPIPVGSIVYVAEGYPGNVGVVHYRLEIRELTKDNQYPLHLKEVNPENQRSLILSEGWERWESVFFRIEDAIEFANHTRSQSEMVSVS